VKAFAVSSCGATAIEYALIASLISIVIATAATSIGTSISSDFNALMVAWK
jgi:pilus assembly protein Flp/PilA